MKNHLLRLLAHMAWADERTADAIEQCRSPVPDAERLFAHIAAAEHLWYSRIQSRTPELEVWPKLASADARQVAARHAALFGEMVGGSSDDQLHRTIAYTNSAGRSFSNSIADIITHVALHGERHRGQIARVVRAAGGEPPYTDFIQFARRDQ